MWTREKVAAADGLAGAVGVLLFASFVGRMGHGAFLLTFENIEIFKFFNQAFNF